jgi:hypothetical protein
VVTAGVAWFAINWAYSAVLSGKDSQIAVLRERISAYEQSLKGASPDQAAGEIRSLREQLAETKKKLTELTNPPRDENSIYQRGQRIGVAAGVNVDMPNRRVTIAQMTVAGDIDRATNIEFRNLVLMFVDSDVTSQARMGLDARTTYGNARLSIVGNRQDQAPD